MGMTTKTLRKPTAGRGFLTADVIKELQAANGKRMNVGQISLFDSAELKASKVQPTEATISPDSTYTLFGLDKPVKHLADFEITPQLARKLLELNTQNRSLSDKLINDYARYIQEGSWTGNGDTIRFSVDGYLLDGQHRLAACVLSDTPFTTDIRFGLPRIAQMTIDSGRKRTIGDQLSLTGEQYGPAIAATCRVIFGIALELSNVRLSTLEVAAFLQKFDKLRDSVTRVYKQKIKGANPAQLAAIHFIATQCFNQQAKADKFVGVFSSGIPAYAGDPSHKLRERLIEMRAKGTPFSSTRQLQNLLYVWDLFRDAKTVPRLTLTEREGFYIRGFDPKMLGINAATNRVTTGRANLPQRSNSAAR